VNRMARLGASAIIVVIGEIAIAVTASSVALPKRYPYLIPVTAFTVAVILTAVSDSRREQKFRPRRRDRSSPQVSADEKIHVLRGKRQRRPGSQVLAGYGSLCTAYLTFLFGLALVTGTSRIHQSPAAGVLLLCASVVAVAFGVTLCRGLRISLTFSSEGVLLTDARGRHLLRWTQATNFHTMRPFLLAIYLVAEPVPGSEYFLGPWGFDRANNLIRVCDLTAFGISRSDVDGALQYWRAHCSVT
jgi:hypothetical protein